MKKGMRSFLLLALVSALVLFSITLVSAVTGFGAIGSWFEGIFKGVNISGASGLFSDQTLNTQILLFLLVTLIMYSIAESIPFLESKGWIAFGVSLIIGALATLFLKSQEVNTILLTYGALGIGLTIIVPFVAAAVVAKKLSDNQHHFASKLVWIAVALAYIVKIGNANLDDIGATGLWFSIIFLGGAIAMALWEHRVYLFLFKEQIKNASVEAKAQALAEVTAQLNILLEQINNAPSKEVEDKLIQKHNLLAKRQRQLGGNWQPL
jgi:glutamate mutase epsilon subunit